MSAWRRGGPAREIAAALGAAVVATVLLQVGEAVVAFRVLEVGWTFLLCLVAAVGWRGLAAVRRRTPAPPEPEVVVSQAWPYSGAFARVGYLAGLVDFVPSEARHFEYGVRPLLVELVDDRLRRHHGVDRRERPDLAERIVGAELWEVVTTVQRRSPSADQLRSWVRRIEEL